MISQRSQQIRSVPAVLFTHSIRTSGQIRSLQWRFSDTLNSLDQDFVLIHNATVQPLDTAREAIFTSTMLIRRDQIILAQPRESRAGIELPSDRQGMRTQRQPVRVNMEVSPFVIEGTLHLPPGLDLLQHMHDAHNDFMPVTDAEVLINFSPFTTFRAPFLLVNRRNIEIALDIAQIGQPEEEDPDIAPVAVMDSELSGAQAAELLAATEVFKRVDTALLQQVAAELCEAARISRKIVQANAEIFHQGDIGDTLYVVENGQVEILVQDIRTKEERHVAYSGPGDFFGEMAILGEGKRSATVRAVSQSSLVALHEEAVKVLMRRFPSATTNMLAVMLRRQAGLDAASRSQQVRNW